MSLHILNQGLMICVQTVQHRDTKKGIALPCHAAGYAVMGIAQTGIPTFVKGKIKSDAPTAAETTRCIATAVMLRLWARKNKRRRTMGQL
jgi:hypothetical protein